MNRILRKVPYYRFQKNEFRNFITGLLAMLETFNPQSMFFKTWFDRLKSTASHLSSLRVRHGSLPQTLELSKVRTKSLALMKAITGQVRVLQIAKLQSQAVALEKVNLFVKSYLKPIISADWMKRMDILNEMFVILQFDEDLKTAVEELSLNLYFVELKTLIDSQTTVSESRSVQIRQRIKVHTLELKSTVKTSLLELFSAIELAQIEHPEIDYSELINGINEKLNYYCSQVKTRESLGKKGKDDKSNPIDPIDDSKAA